MSARAAFASGSSSERTTGRGAASPPAVVAEPKLKRFFVGLGIAGSFGVAPQPFLAPHLAFGVNARPFVFELDVRAQWWSMIVRPLGPTAVDVQTYSGSAAGCLARGAFLGCAVVSAGAVDGAGLNRTYLAHLSTSLMLAF